jgi:transcription elongation factor SPT6
MSARELIDDRALEDEEDDESFDEETGDVRERPNGSHARFDDSSEEDEDDDDEEAAAEVCISFKYLCHGN